MNIKQQLQSYKTQVDEYLVDFFSRKKKECAEISDESLEVITHLEEYTMRGGKRIRPALIYYTAKLFNPELNDHNLIALSSFVELTQSWLLIHDDIADHDEIRRNGPTYHKIYEGLSDKYYFQDKNDFGGTMAIMAGDLANILAIEILSNSNFPPIKINEILHNYSKFISNVIFGQIHDILITKKTKYSQEDILKIHRYKTATYTFQIPVLTGAILGGATKEQKELLNEYSINVGIAFQIRDDILGVFGDESKTGKSSYSDLKEGKKTLLTYKVDELSTEEERSIFFENLGDEYMDENKAENMRRIIKDSGALDYSIEQCEKYVEKANEALTKLNLDEKTEMDILYELSKYMLKRNN